MKILAIETSCDETSIALLEAGRSGIKVLSNAISSQIKIHNKFGGVVPALASREHVKNLPKVLSLALNGKALSEIDLMAVTSGPGLISSLLVGAAFASALAWKNKIPILGINHMEGHIYSNWLKPIGQMSEITKEKETFPSLCLIVSGGHTQLVLMKNHGLYELVGQTRDDAAGEAFDKIARILGLPYPGGPAISKIALGGDEKKYPLPSPMINSKNYEFSFAGLKTAVLYLVRDILKKQKINRLPPRIRADIAASAQKAIVDVLVSKTLKAAKKFKVKSIMLSGGVSASRLLRQRLTDEGKLAGIRITIPELEFTTDNAAMIGAAAFFNFRKNKTGDWRKLKTDANWEIV